MRRAILNVSTHLYVRGQWRLVTACQRFAPDAERLFWTNRFPPGSPDHFTNPYAFKAYAIAEAQRRGIDLVLWADASIVIVKPLDSLWARIEKDGYWISRNGWKNGEWCSDEALSCLFVTRDEAMEQEHVVATSFGLNLKSATGAAIADEYMRFAKNGAFRGPWDNAAGQASSDPRVRGHRHDQTALSAIAHRMGLSLTSPPAPIAYAGGETDETLLVVDGSF